MVPKIKSLPLIMQAMSIKNMFPDSRVTTYHDYKLIWRHTITPSPLGDFYNVRIIYHVTNAPKIFIVDPMPLSLAKGKTKLPHCYDQKLQRLCLYYPNGVEWNKTMLLSNTVIPWTFEWLYHYEIWLCTGEWTGGGIHLNKDKLKISR